MAKGDKPLLRAVIGLPRGAPKEENYGNSLVSFFPAKDKVTGKARTTKSGGQVYTGALDLTNLKNMAKKYPAIVKKDTRTDHEIVWVTGFVPEGGNPSSGEKDW